MVLRVDDDSFLVLSSHVAILVFFNNYNIAMVYCCDDEDEFAINDYFN